MRMLYDGIRGKIEQYCLEGQKNRFQRKKIPKIGNMLNKHNMQNMQNMTDMEDMTNMSSMI
jgi:hypothetical protein